MLKTNKVHVKQAVDACKAGGVIAYPTESVFGLGCLPAYEHAVRRILLLKRRSVRKGLICVAANIRQLANFVDFSRLDNLHAVLQTWPGPVTWLMSARSGVPYWLTGAHTTLAVRVSADPVVQSLCKQLGPIVSTSANRQGMPPAHTTQKVRSYFGKDLDYIFPANLNRRQKSTEIRDALSNKIIRQS